MLSQLLSVPADIALPYFLVLATPGPNLFIVLRASLQKSSQPAFAAAIGIALGAGAAALAAALGTATLLPAGTDAAARLVLVVLLARTGWSSIAAARRADGAEEQGGQPERFFRTAFLTAIANPLTIPFFIGLFASHVPPGSPTLVACLTIVVLAAGWFISLANLLRYPRVRQLFLRARRPLNLAIGLALLASAASAALPLLP